MVNSFNEWHEDTQIEASTTSPLTNTDDSPSGSAYTAGRYYEGYGNRYLEILRSATVVRGDYNGDGDVDADDYLAWTQTYGASGPNLKADGNRDGFVGAADFVVWRNALPTGGGVSGTIVPEPSTALMLILLVTPLGLWRHRNAPLSRNDLSAMQRHTTLIRESARLP